jgi:hypothetical protein
MPTIAIVASFGVVDLPCTMRREILLLILSSQIMLGPSPMEGSSSSIGALKNGHSLVVIEH